MVLDDFADDGQAQASAIGLAKADEGIEQGVADASGYAVAIVVDANFEGIAGVFGLHGDGTLGIRGGFTGIENEVEKDAFQLPGVEHAFQILGSQEDNADLAEFGFRVDGLNGAADNLVNASKGRSDGIALIGEFAKRVNEVSHLSGSGFDLFVDFVFFQLQLIRFVKEFRVGDDRGEVMAQIVGNGTGGASQCVDALRFNSLLLESQELAAHLCE